MQTDNRFLDDLAKVASGALGSVSGMRHEVEVRLQQQMERLLARMNLVNEPPERGRVGPAEFAAEDRRN